MSLLNWAVLFAAVSAIASLCGLARIAQGSAVVAYLSFSLSLIVTLVQCLIGIFCRAVSRVP